jgi:tetratricopeptide (TPR) repeat protein
MNLRKLVSVLKNRAVWIIPSAIVIIFAVVVGGYLVWNKFYYSPTQFKNNIQSAAAASAKRDYPLAIKSLNEAQKQAGSTLEKISVYEQLALALGNAGKYQDALKYFDLKHKLAPGTTSQDALIMADYYQRLGDKTKALELYRVALDYSKQQKPSSMQSKTDYIQGQIDELEGDK